MPEEVHANDRTPGCWDGIDRPLDLGPKLGLGECLVGAGRSRWIVTLIERNRGVGPPCPPAAKQVDGGGACGSTNIGRRDPGDLLSSPFALGMGVPEPDPHLLYQLVRVGTGQPMPPAHVPEDASELADDILECRREPLCLGTHTCPKYAPGRGAANPRLPV